MPVKKPVDSQDDGDVLRGQPDGVEHHDHGDKSGLGDSRGSDGGRRRRDGDGDDLADGEAHVPDLGDEDGRNSLVQSSPVHVDGRADGQDESAK